MDNDILVSFFKKRIDTICDRHSKYFSDVYFENRKSGSPLVLDLNNHNIKDIKLINKSNGKFHLGSIEIYENDINIAERCTLSQSSLMRPVKNFLKPNFCGMGLLTRQEVNPWVVISLPRICSIGKIIINNRNGDKAARSYDLEISTSENSTKWQTLYNHRGREKIFLDYVRNLPIPCNIERTFEQLVRTVDRNTVNILGTKYTETKISMTQTDMAPEVFESIFKSWERRILNRRNRAWTSHGPKRPFRFWSPEEKQDYLSFGLELERDLKLSFENVVFGFGTCLAAFREKELIDHDDDIDIIVVFPNLGRGSIDIGLREISRHLTNHGYTVKRNYFSHRHVSKPKRGTIDVFVGIREGEFLSVYPSDRRKTSYSDVFPTIQIQFMGQNYNFPKCPDRYLTSIYGPNWRKPKIVFSHAKNKESYSAIK